MCLGPVPSGEIHQVQDWRVKAAKKEVTRRLGLARHQDGSECEWNEQWIPSCVHRWAMAVICSSSARATEAQIGIQTSTLLPDSTTQDVSDSTSGSASLHQTSFSTGFDLCIFCERIRQICLKRAIHETPINITVTVSIIFSFTSSSSPFCH